MSFCTASRSLTFRLYCWPQIWLPLRTSSSSTAIVMSSPRSLTRPVRRDGFGFTLKSLAELRAGNFDRDEAIQPRVPTAIHFAHAASADGREDFVWAEFVAGRKLHMTDGS